MENERVVYLVSLFQKESSNEDENQNVSWKGLPGTCGDYVCHGVSIGSDVGVPVLFPMGIHCQSRYRQLVCWIPDRICPKSRP